jgi:predicted small lipoprotein YifL
MKRMITLALALLLLFSMGGCGSGSTDPQAEAIASNNEHMQEKMEEMTVLGMELANAYVEHAEAFGYSQEDMQVVYDTAVAQIETANANHQSILDGGGYDDETLAQMEEVVDAAIAGYTQSKEQLNSALEAAGII